MTLPYMYPDPKFLQKLIAVYRSALTPAGQPSEGPEILGKFHIYVADSLDQAVREAEPYMHNYWNVRYVDDPDRRQRRGSEAHDVRSQMAQEFIIAGDPQRCIDAIHHWQDTIGLTTLSGTFHFGGMPQELALKNLRLFAEKVAPAFQREQNAEHPTGHETA
jgi:alkanesulfonate monooxygenase SsuD/methylene tetrahydromethanopterin reductase-like flavin-dependent oxidoreductase (luciferase family)